MRKPFFATCWIISLCMLHANFAASHACTIVTASIDGKAFFGGNEDQLPNESYMVVDKRGKYGVVYFATPWKEIPLSMQMGINEEGLCYDTNWIPLEEIDHRPTAYQREWAVLHLIKTAASVEEVVSRMHSLNWGESMEYQVHFADHFGDAIVIHPGANGELSYTRKAKDQTSLISTNFNLAILEGEEWECLRYRRAQDLLGKLDTGETLNAAFMASVLHGTRQDGQAKTLYSAVYDLVDRRIFLYGNRHFDQPHVLDVKKELQTSSRYRRVALEELVGSEIMGTESIQKEVAEADALAAAIMKADTESELSEVLQVLETAPQVGLFINCVRRTLTEKLHQENWSHARLIGDLCERRFGESWRTYAFLAKTYYDSGNPDGAKHFLEKGLSVHPSSTELADMMERFQAAVQ